MNGQEVGVAQVLKSAGFLLRLREDHDLLLAVGLNKALDVVELALKALRNDGHASQLVRQLVLVVTDQVDHDWTLHALCSDVLYELGHRCREDHRSAAFVCDVRLDFHDVVLEAHV